MRIGVLRESAPGERRAALTPTALGPLKKAGGEVVFEPGAGLLAGYSDAQYEAAGAVAAPREEVLGADLLAAVRLVGADPEGFGALKKDMRAGQTWIGHADPLSHPKLVAEAAATGARVFAMELIPRTTRAQAMDALSSQANLAGYKAVLIGAGALDKVLPMMTTAAGTIPPAKVLVLGAGVAGLQAIATAKRLGAVVTGYDVRPEVRSQIESLGARFLELDLQAEQGEGGYAKEQSAEFIRRQQELMGDALAEMDLVVTTAAVPGRKAPVLITTPMAEKMRPGSVVVDMAAERGGNCELTQPGQTVDHRGIQILGPMNLPSTMAYHASSVYAKNVASFILNMVKDKALNIDKSDQIVAESLICEDGQVANARVAEALK